MLVRENKDLEKLGHLCSLSVLYFDSYRWDIDAETWFVISD